MKWSRLQPRERLLIGVVLIVIVLGSYGLLRMRPAFKDLAAMKQSVEKTEVRLKTTEMPEVDESDDDAVERGMRQAEAALAGLQASMELVDRRLAPPDSQELRLKISELARQSGVFILESRPYTLPPVTAAGAGAAPAGKAARRARAQIAAPAAPAGAAEPVLLPVEQGLPARMAPGTLLSRPMQQLGLEGDFDSVRGFLRGLELLPWQVSVVQLRLEAKPGDAPVGFRQRLSVSAILAL